MQRHRMIQKDYPTQPPTDQTGGGPPAGPLTIVQVVEAMVEEMRGLRTKIDTLETNAATAFNGVQQQAGQAQGMASELHLKPRR